ncbi:TPA: hypothetical protein HGS83_11825 [Escherichia coli]|uniref:hypothetical protein n=1 Tax=Enterobacteriaceae TaxID=543 RepID=UPI000A368F2F|nr:hypothetical protein [Escherichia coli]HBS0886769.1 hypothetical protein [Klebsiella pneumoniae]HCD6957764.1 hypothetical protein [Klebsiella variicola]NBY92007.1 hypothetical protein [Escherichia coli]NBZ67781.1 hypothetical protein [Escherichia coli]NBZ82088.1 hypothetical protein [Escherichia coli]
MNTKYAKHSTSKCNLLPQELRIHCVSVRLNNAELAKLNTLREHYSKGEWLRMASLQKLPPVIPAINTEAWKALSDISQKLNRIAAHIDGKSKDSHLTHTELFAVKRQLEELRHNLLRTDFWSAPREGYAEDQEG